MPDARRPRRPRPARPVDPARSAALEVLRLVRTEDAYTNLVLPSVVATPGLDTPRRRVRHRARGRHDPPAGDVRRDPRRLHRPAAAPGRVRDPRHPAARLPPAARHAGAARTPRSAAPSTSRTPRPARVPPGFVNAVLRSVARRDLDAWVARGRAGPVGVEERRMDHLASSTATRAGWSTCSTSPLRTTTSTPCSRPTTSRRRSRSSRDPAAPTVAELPGTPTPYSPYGVVLDGRRPGRGPGGRRGSRRRPGRGLAAGRARAGRRAPVDGSDEVWVDLCAGPGGKAALLAALAAERGAGVLAIEQHAAPGRLVRRALGGAGGCRVHRRRRRRRHQAAAGARRAPTGCSSTRRAPAWARCAAGPEARWRRSPDDLLTLVLLQRRLLAGASSWSGPGASSSTRPARRCGPRPSTWCRRCSRPATQSPSRTSGRCCPG